MNRIYFLPIFTLMQFILHFGLSQEKKNSFHLNLQHYSLQFL